MKSLIALILIQLCVLIVSIQKSFNINKQLKPYRRLVDDIHSRIYFIDNEIKALQLMENYTRNKKQKSILNEIINELRYNNTIQLPLLKEKYKNHYNDIKKFSRYLNNTFNVKLQYKSPPMIHFYPDYLDEVELQDAAEEE